MPRVETRAEGMRIRIQGIGNGLTVDKQGRALLKDPFVFQCPPLEQFSIQHQQNFGTYDTIDDDQFVRRGSRQLDTWSFDTLAMYLGADAAGHPLPRWVPYPTHEPRGRQFRGPNWYRDQLVHLHNAGSPFRMMMAFQRATPIRSTFAVLTAFNEVYKHGEGDTIYFSSVTFSEWRDPGDASRIRHKVPAHVHFRVVDGHYIAFRADNGRNIPTRHKTGTTLADLARYYYGDGSKWRHIAVANHLKGGAGETPIFKHWYPHRFAHGKPHVTMTIPKLTAPPPSARTPPAKSKTKR